MGWNEQIDFEGHTKADLLIARLDELNENIKQLNEILRVLIKNKKKKSDAAWK